MLRVLSVIPTQIAPLDLAAAISWLVDNLAHILQIQECQTVLWFLHPNLATIKYLLVSKIGRCAPHKVDSTSTLHQDKEHIPMLQPHLSVLIIAAHISCSKMLFH